MGQSRQEFKIDKIDEKFKDEGEVCGKDPQVTDIETWHRLGMDSGWPHVWNLGEVSLGAASVGKL